jgi:pimeloyl-ACP methyl ester carboxylesterase
MPALVDDVANLITTVAGGRCCLVGHDWGAFLAWFTAMTHPELVRKLVILNVPHPAAFSRELRRSRKQQRRVLYQVFFQLPLLPELSMRLFGRNMMRRLGRFSEEEIDAYAKSWPGSLTPMFNYYRAMRRTRGELSRMVRPLDLPVMMIWGEREPVFIRETTETPRELVPDFRFEPVPRIGHFVQHDAPDRVNELLLDFLAA